MAKYFPLVHHLQATKKLRTRNCSVTIGDAEPSVSADFFENRIVVKLMRNRQCVRVSRLTTGRKVGYDRSFRLRVCGGVCCRGKALMTQTELNKKVLPDQLTTKKKAVISASQLRDDLRG